MKGAPGAGPRTGPGAGPGWLLPGLLLLSGFCGISYEILYTRLLGNLLGNQFAINASVLLTFLLGIGWGTLHAHRLARFLPAIEAGIGVYSLAFALANPWIDRALYARLPAVSGSLFGCVAVAFVLLLIPAFLVGCSVPLFAGYLAARHSRNVFAITYGIYNVGAALTALTLEYVLLRSAGIRLTTLVLACLNGVVALGVIVATRGLTLPPAPEPTPFPRRLLGALALASVASAIFQLLMIRLAEFLLGPFNETFSLVLTTVLLGLALGSLAVGRFGLTFAGALVLSLGGLVALMLGLPSAMKLYAATYPDASGFYPMLIVAKLGLVMVLMGAPAVGFGATVPALLRTSRDDVARESGQLLFCSAVANALGFLLMAAVLHQHLDYGWLLVVVGALTAGAVVLSWCPSRAAVMAAVALAAAIVVTQRTVWDEMLLYLSYTSFQSPKRLVEAQRDRTLADRFKGPEDVFAISWVDGKPFFFINGYISVSLTSPAERVVGGLSSMLSPRLDRALVLGMGTGATAGVVAPVFARTDVVEINRVVLDNLHRMAAYNLDIERRPQVRIIHDDGIHWIKTTEARYSLILNTVTSPRYFSSSKLYTRDFFDMVLGRLTPDGVYVTWLDGRIGDRGFDIILQTLRGAFARCWLGYLRSNYFMLACSNGPLALHQFTPVADHPELRHYFADAFRLPVRLLPYGVISVDAFALQGDRTAPVNTLDFPVLEFEMSRLGTATQLREFKGRLAAQLDFVAVQAAAAPFPWSAAEFAVATHLQLPPDTALARTLTGAVDRQRGVDPREYDRRALALADELGTAEAYYTFGRRLLKIDHDAAAVRALERAVALDPKRGDAQYELGVAYRAVRAYPSALAQFVLAWETHRESRAPLRAAAVLLELERYEEALTWLGRTRQVLRGRPTATVLYYEGVAREGLGDRARAAADYEAALTRDPAHARASAALQRLRTSPAVAARDGRPAAPVADDHRHEAPPAPERAAKATSRGESPPETESMPRGVPEGP